MKNRNLQILEFCLMLIKTMLGQIFHIAQMSRKQANWCLQNGTNLEKVLIESGTKLKLKNPSKQKILEISWQPSQKDKLKNSNPSNMNFSIKAIHFMRFNIRHPYNKNKTKKKMIKMQK